MKKESIIFCLIIALSFVIACREKGISSYEKFLQSWMGKSEASLVETWGAPDEMQTIMPNRQIFVYIKERRVYLDPAVSMPNSFLGNDSLYEKDSNNSGQVLEYFCQTTFTTQDDIIVDYSFEGDGCI